MLKRLFSIFSCILILGSLPIAARAESNIDLSSPSAILIEAESRKILSEKNSHERRACASVTKVMTLLLVMEAVESGKLKLNDTLSASAHAASMGGSDIWLEEGERMSVDDLIKATAVASANDAAVVLAEAVSGSEKAFVEEMNKRAKKLGMKHTVFKNCNGLDEKGHLTCAYDVALMSSELIKYKKIFDYTSIWIDELRGGKTQIVNTNKLLRTYDGITGLKTGTTGDAGSCISATAERNGLSLIAVVLGAGSGTERFRDAAALLDYGFANFESAELKLTEELYPVTVDGGMESTVDIVCSDIGYITIPKGQSDKVERTLNISESIPAPVGKGAKVGTLRFSMDGEEMASFDVVTAGAVEKKSFVSVFALLWNALIKL